MAQRRVETPAQLRRVIAQLPSEHPFTDGFSAKWERSRPSAGRQQERRDVWYETQHQHWLGWLDDYDGPGAYGRQDGPRSAEFVYNHVVNPQMLIYLAEALEIEVAILRSAQRDALTKNTMMAMSAAFRRVVPWCVIEAAIAARAQAAARGRRPRATPSPPGG